MSPYSGLGSTHTALVDRLENGLINEYELSLVHEYKVSKNPLTRLWRRWFSGPNSVSKLASESDIVHVTDQEQAGLIPKTGNTVVAIHDLFHLFPQEMMSKSVTQISGMKKIWQRFVKEFHELSSDLSKDTQQECE